MKKIILFTLLIFASPVGYMPKAIAKKNNPVNKLLSYANITAKPPANNFRRLAAFLLNETIIVGIACALLGWQGIIQVQVSTNPFSFNVNMNSLSQYFQDSFLKSVINYAIVAGMHAGIEILLWLVQGFGKRVLAIKVVDEKGRDVKIEVIAWRSVCKWFLAPVTWLWALFTPEQQALHDIIAKTCVVDAA